MVYEVMILSDAAGDALACDDPADICEINSAKHTDTNVHEIKR